MRTEKNVYIIYKGHIENSSTTSEKNENEYHAIFFQASTVKRLNFMLQAKDL